jgi:methionine biosynthesis protein MetW
MTSWNTERWITPSDVERSRTSYDLDGLRAAVDTIHDTGVKRFLDIGCGFGGLARLVGDYLGADEVHGVDIDPRVVEEAAQKNVSVVLQDASEGTLPYEDGYFDAVMSLGMMDYLQYFDGVIREISRVTKMGGFVIVSLPNLGSWHNRLMLMLGYQPRDVEISSEILAGVPQRPYRQQGEGPAGHIHIPTLRAFVELMEHHGYDTVKVLAGRPNARTTSNRAFLAIDRLSSLRPSLARRFFYVGRRARITAKPKRSPHMPYELL